MRGASSLGARRRRAQGALAALALLARRLRRGSRRDRSLGDVRRSRGRGAGRPAAARATRDRSGRARTLRGGAGRARGACGRAAGAPVDRVAGRVRARRRAGRAALRRRRLVHGRAGRERRASRRRRGRSRGRERTAPHHRGRHGGANPGAAAAADRPSARRIRPAAGVAGARQALPALRTRDARIGSARRLGGAGPRAARLPRRRRGLHLRRNEHLAGSGHRVLVRVARIAPLDRAARLDPEAGVHARALQTVVGADAGRGRLVRRGTHARGGSGGRAAARGVRRAGRRGAAAARWTVGTVARALRAARAGSRGGRTAVRRAGPARAALRRLESRARAAVGPRRVRAVPGRTVRRHAAGFPLGPVLGGRRLPAVRAHAFAVAVRGRLGTLVRRFPVGAGGAGARWRTVKRA